MTLAQKQEQLQDLTKERKRLLEVYYQGGPDWLQNIRNLSRLQERRRAVEDQVCT